jgi:hypothetical protein
MSNDSNLSPEIIAALRAGKKHADAAKLDMLCKAGAYSKRELEVITKEPYWLGVMADCETIDAAIKALS